MLLTPTYTEFARLQCAYLRLFAAHLWSVREPRNRSEGFSDAVAI